MEKKDNGYSFETLIIKIIHEELLILKSRLYETKNPNSKRYITMKEAVSSTGISSSVLRQLTYSRAMPHLKVKGRLVFNENAIQETIVEYKEFGWSDPEDKWAVAKVHSEILDFEKNKEDSKMIEDILREIIREELNNFSKDLKSQSKKEKTSYYGRTILTIKEGAEYFRTSPATIYNLIKEAEMPHLKIQSRSFIVLEEAEAYLWRETAKSYATQGNIYWQRILQNLDWEERERNAAYAKALKKLEEEF